MKKLITSFLTFLFLYTQTIACNRSSMILNSIVETSGPNYTITVDISIGYGRSGLIYGAQDNTNTWGIAIFGSSCNTPTSWIPVLITGPNPPNTTYSSILSNTFDGFGYGEDNALIFYDTLLTNVFACVTTTEGCGLPGTYTVSVTMNFSCMPDSIRMIGVEGFGACDADNDMFIDFSILLNLGEPDSIPKLPVMGLNLLSEAFYQMDGTFVANSIKDLPRGLYMRKELFDNFETVYTKIYIVE